MSITNSSEEVDVSAGEQTQPVDIDPTETSEWIGSLDYVLKSKGPERVKYLLKTLDTKARSEGVDVPLEVNTPYINTIPRHKQPAYPGNREIERRIKSIIRWNAMAMVQRANKKFDGWAAISVLLLPVLLSMKWASITSSAVEANRALTATSSTSKATRRRVCTRELSLKAVCR